jgi:predicted amidohydrolase YtcJ
MDEMDGGAGMALRNGAGLLLVRARRLHTLAGDPAEAMVVFAGRVVATGDARILAEQFPVERTVELDGVVLPGFNDAHSHPTMTAENLLHVDCSPDVAPDEETLVRLLRDEAAHTERGGWVIGSRYDHSKTTSGRVVDRAFLDRIVPDRPVLLVHVAAHWGVLNSAGLSAARLDEETAGPPGGLLGRDGTGRLNGVVYEQALFDIAYPSLAREATVVPPSTMTQRLRGLGRTLRMFHAAGLTSTCDALCGPHDVRLLMEARAQGQLTLRTGMLVAHPHYDHLSTLGLRGGFGDDKLRLVGVKAFVDGACAGGNCLVDEPFEGTDDHGMQIMETEHIETLVRRATQDELVIAVHANGDRAIRLLLDAHDKARRDGAAGSTIRHRIEHCSLVDDQIIARIRELGLVVVPFGSYARFHGDKLPGYYGHERLERMFAHRSFLDAGVPVAGSSDYPCGPVEPLAAITSCVERRSLDGELIGGSQRISVAEAIALYTTGSAYASGEEHMKGRLAPGMLADFVELSGDPFDTPPADIAHLEVRSTWVGAECVYEPARAAVV